MMTPSSPNWYQPIRRAVFSRLELPAPGVALPVRPLVTYISRQGSRRSLADSSHDALLKELDRAWMEEGWDVEVVQMGKLSKRDQIALISRTTVSTLARSPLPWPHSRIKQSLTHHRPRLFACSRLLPDPHRRARQRPLPRGLHGPFSLLRRVRPSSPDPVRRAALTQRIYPFARIQLRDHRGPRMELRL